MTLSKSTIPAVALVLAAAAHAQLTETEANDYKVSANPLTVGNGSTISGTSLGNSTTAGGLITPDYFRLNLNAQAPAIYRNQIALTGNGHIGTLRGLQVTNMTAPVFGSDVTLQTSAATTATPNMNQFYTFGDATSMFYRVTGEAATSPSYTATISQTLVTPTDLGLFAPGTITFNTGTTSATDTTILVFDSQFRGIPGYLNEATLLSLNGGTSQDSAYLSRTYAPGTYYVAISDSRTADNRLSPLDEYYFVGPVTDSAGVVFNGTTRTGINVGFTVRDANGVTSVAATKTAAYDVNFYKFTVGQPVPEPATMAALGLGVAALLRRRRKSA